MWQSAQMSGFDAELYLRVIGEGLMINAHPGGQPNEIELFEAAGALAAVSALSRATAQEVLDEYGLAISLRSGWQGWRPGRGRLPLNLNEAIPSCGPRRMIVLGKEVDMQGSRLHLRYLRLGEDATYLSVSIQSANPQQQRLAMGPMRPHPFPGGPPQVKVQDDRGLMAIGHFSGGGSPEEWTGVFQCTPLLAVDTRWIEVEGQRVELPEEAPQCHARVEELPAQDPAQRYLWHRLATRGEHGPEGNLDTAVQALLACGALAEEAPLIAQVREVESRLVPGSRQHPAKTSEIPEPWRSLLSGVSHGATITGDLPVGVVCQPVGGVRVSVATLTSLGDGFQIDVEVEPGWADPRSHPQGLGQEQLAWWARDDRGNHYLGHFRNSSSSPERTIGTVAFRPRLDSRASQLDLMPSTVSARAVIEVPMNWVGSG